MKLRTTLAISWLAAAAYAGGCASSLPSVPVDGSIDAAPGVDASAAIDACTPSAEMCNGADDDCDGIIDDGADATCSIAHASSACSTGACAFTACDAGFADCNAIAADGCEANLATSADACGACDHACASDDSCADGHCGNDVTQISAGGAHTCALRGAGTVSCWGLDDVGELGNGLPHANALEPVTVPGVYGVVQVSAGGGHTCVLRSDGTVGCWGSNVYGQLGDGTRIDRDAAVVVGGIDDAVAVGTGAMYSCALRMGGTVVCWGQNQDHTLGDGTYVDARETPGDVLGVGGVVSLSVGRLHACAVVSDGTAWCWGSNANGMLGNGSDGLEDYPVQVVGRTDVAEVAAGGLHTCARTTAGEAYCWGNNSQGQLGIDAPAMMFSATPVRVMALAGVTQIVAGGWEMASWSCARIGDGTARCWGSNQSGQLGDGTAADRFTPVVVVGFSTIHLRAISAGGWHGCALADDEHAYCWGLGDQGELGDGAGLSRATPVRVTGF